MEERVGAERKPVEPNCGYGENTDVMVTQRNDNIDDLQEMESVDACERNERAIDRNNNLDSELIDTDNSNNHNGNRENIGKRNITENATLNSEGLGVVVIVKPTGENARELVAGN
jgi:hypothetical protein